MSGITNSVSRSCSRLITMQQLLQSGFLLFLYAIFFLISEGEAMNLILAEQLLILFGILAIGCWIGQISIKGISLGAAGVLFVALVFGHFGFKVPKEIMDLGLVLFVYSVGLQAGPRFFRMFKRRGIQFVVIGLVTVVTGTVTIVVVAHFMHIPFDLACGLYTGAMTCTPALAAAMDAMGRVALEQNPNLSVGYGLAYPFSMIGVVLLIQFLPKLLGKNVTDEETKWEQEQAAEAPKMQVKQFRVSNPNCIGMSLKELTSRHISTANITRVRRGKRVFMARPETALAENDVVMVTGLLEELDKMQLLLGDETHVPMDLNTNIMSIETDVTEASQAGKEIRDIRVWERYGVVVTRIKRQGLELAPTGSATLEMGDTLVVVGERDAVNEFAKIMDPGGGKADETHMLPFLMGLVVGIFVGLIPFHFPSGMTVKLGAAGGAFIMSLILGHIGRVGRFRLYVPPAAKNLTRELGLMLFLAGAGTVAGSRFLSVLQQQGWKLLISGALVTVVSVATGLFLMIRIYRMNSLASMGAICACMTNPPGLSAAAAQTRTDIPTLAYASVYPVALIFKIVLAQVLVEILPRILSNMPMSP